MISRTLGLIISLTFAPLSAASAQVVPPAVPGTLEVPSGQPFLIAAAEGTQNYVCLLTQGGFEWTFLGPQATLFVPPQQVMTHFLSANPVDGAQRPTWQHSLDTSRVWGRVRASSSDPAYVAPGAVPWLLLDAASTSVGPAGGGTLAQTTFIQRVNTSGGVAPAAGCRHAGDVGAMALVPYTTEYYFYRASAAR